MGRDLNTTEVKSLEEKRELLARALRRKMAEGADIAAARITSGAPDPGALDPGARGSGGGAPDLNAEAALADDIRVAAPLAQWPQEPRRILLTGATGFLGSHLLHGLLERTGAQIVCIVRAANHVEARRRVLDNLAEHRLDAGAHADRIEALTGDVTLPRLGQDQAAWDDLARRIDWIYHNAAMVNFAYPYKLLKSANVDSLREVLRLTIRDHVKPLHFVSSLGIFTSDDYEGRLVDEELILEPGSKFDCGYVQTKWVADKLACRARERGLPVAIYRLGLVTGDTVHGIGGADGLIIRMIKSCIQMGLAPDFEIHVETLPVDYAAQAISHLSRSPASLGKNFHLANSHTLPWHQLIDWIVLAGYRIRKVPYDAWKEELLRQTRLSTDNAMYPLVPLMRETMSQEQLFASARMARFSCRNTEAGLHGTGLSCPPLDLRLLATYMAHFVSTGMIQPPPAA
jgi:thioester reductase-like protein